MRITALKESTLPLNPISDMYQLNLLIDYLPLIVLKKIYYKGRNVAIKIPVAASTY